jgi:hypothetical protein
MVEYEHTKDYIVAVFIGIIGWMGFKLKQKDIRQAKHEDDQDSRIQNLERRTSNVERNMGIIEERTKHLLDDGREIKSDLKELLNRGKTN